MHLQSRIYWIPQVFSDQSRRMIGAVSRKGTLESSVSDISLHFLLSYLLNSSQEIKSMLQRPSQKIPCKWSCKWQSLSSHKVDGFTYDNSYLACVSQYVAPLYRQLADGQAIELTKISYGISPAVHHSQ